MIFVSDATLRYSFSLTGDVANTVFIGDLRFVATQRGFLQKD
jgi:hypothetical protein